MAATGVALLSLSFFGLAHAEDTPPDNRCIQRCECARELIGGGAALHILSFTAGEQDATTGFMWGGRAYGYLIDGALRVGGMGMGGTFSHADDWAQSFSLGGPTVDSVLHLGRSIELTVGLWAGLGRGTWETTLEKNAQGPNTRVIREESGMIMAVVPSIGFEFNPLRWLKIALNATALYADANPDAFYGYGGGLTIMFGKFWPADLTGDGL